MNQTEQNTGLCLYIYKLQAFFLGQLETRVAPTATPITNPTMAKAYFVWQERTQSGTLVENSVIYTQPVIVLQLVE